MKFDSTINGKDSWGKLFQSKDAFKQLVKEIFMKHGFNFTGLESLTPGTNAVFRVDDKVVKIFAPVESGFFETDYYTIETEAQIHANNVHITAPKILAAGIIEDKYIFRYIIMDFINGQEAEHKLLSYSKEQKINFASQLKSISEKLNIKIKKRIPEFSINYCLENDRWNDFSEGFLMERKDLIKNYSFNDFVYVHGDLTAENIIISDDGVVNIIDFADSLVAPHYYEWPPIVFALFGCEPIMMEAYFGKYHSDKFYNQLIMGLLIHEFGASIIKELCKLRNISVNEIANIGDLRIFIIDILESQEIEKDPKG
jgi:serine/threonine protein kinase